MDTFVEMTFNVFGTLRQHYAFSNRAVEYIRKLQTTNNKSLMRTKKRKTPEIAFSDTTSMKAIVNTGKSIHALKNARGAFDYLYDEDLGGPMHQISSISLPYMVSVKFNGANTDGSVSTDSQNALEVGTELTMHGYSPWRIPETEIGELTVVPITRYIC